MPGVVIEKYPEMMIANIILQFDWSLFVHDFFKALADQSLIGNAKLCSLFFHSRQQVQPDKS
jgi:hypothetical protein